jgi:hypothetical protein
LSPGVPGHIYLNLKENMEHKVTIEIKYDNGHLERSTSKLVAKNPNGPRLPEDEIIDPTNPIPIETPEENPEFVQPLDKTNIVPFEQKELYKATSNQGELREEYVEDVLNELFSDMID